MLENAMVYISLEDFKELENDAKLSMKLRTKIASCYKAEKFENETLHMCVDTDLLIKVTEPYSCFGKGNYAYCENINITKK